MDRDNSGIDDDDDNERPGEAPSAGPIDVPPPPLGDEEFPELGRFRGTRRAGQLIFATLVLGLLVLGLDKTARWWVERTGNQAWACLQDERLGALEDCRIHLRLSSLWPTTRAEALLWQAKIDYGIARGQLAQATHEHIDFEARDRAAAQLRAAYGVLDDLDSESGRELVRDLASNGAHAAALAAALAAGQSNSRSARIEASYSALQLGEAEALTKLWSELERDQWTQARLVPWAAWLCLSDAEAGRDALNRIAQELHEDSPRAVSVEHSLAMRACGTDLRDNSFPRPAPRAARAWVTASELGKADEWLVQTFGPDKAVVLAQAIVGGAGLESIVDWIAPYGPSLSTYGVLSHVDEQALAGRGMLLDRHLRAAPIYDPATLQAAARQLISLAEGLGTSEAELAAEAEIVAGLAARSGFDDEPIASRAELLRHGAAVLADLATLEWIVRGERDRALALALEAGPWHRAEIAWYSMGLRLLAGDAQAVLDWVEPTRAAASKAPETTPPEVLDELEVRALVQLGRFPEALERASAYHDAARKRSGLEPLAPDHTSVLANLCLAISVQLGEFPCELTPTTTSLDGRLLAALTKPDDHERARALRWRELELALPLGSAAPLDIRAVVLASLAPSPDQAETWLDVAVRVGPSVGRELYWAQAEAARWRGDTEAQRRWLDRAQTVLGTATATDLGIVDIEDRAMLIHLAGL